MRTLSNKLRSSSRRYILALSLGLLAALAVSSCGGTDDLTVSKIVTPTVPNIDIRDSKFSPDDVHVKAGESVSVTNIDVASHTLTAVDKSFDSGPLSEHQTASIVVSKPGRFEYICSIHPYMRGVIVADSAG